MINTPFAFCPSHVSSRAFTQIISQFHVCIFIRVSYITVVFFFFFHINQLNKFSWFGMVPTQTHLYSLIINEQEM